MYISPVTTGIPAKTITEVQISVGAFSIDAIQARLEYKLITDTGMLAGTGAIQMTPEQFTNWGAENTPYLEDIVLNELGLTRPE